MIWFFSPGGRTGNQLFQYAFLESLRRPGEWVITTQFDSFKRLFRVRSGYLNTDVRWVINLNDHLVSPLIYHLLVRTRFVSSWIEDLGVLRYRRGLICSLRFVRGYFQNPHWWDRSGTVPRGLLPSSAVAKAEEVLAAVPVDKEPVFLHLRRGDYLTWSVLGKMNPSLPLGYYREAIRRIWAVCPQAYFIVTGDDPSFAETELEWLGEFWVSRESPAVDLALMSGCRYGILSNSTLAWWGGYWMTDRRKVLAPEFWLGYRSGMEYPRGVIPPWAEVVPLTDWSSQQEAL